MHHCPFAWIAVVLCLPAVTACGASSAKTGVSADSEAGRAPDIFGDTAQPGADAQTSDTLPAGADAQTSDTLPAEVDEDTLAPSDADEEDVDFGAEDGESGSDIETDATPIDADGTVDARGVTIVVAVGERDAEEGCFFVGDSQSDARGCRLHRLVFEPDTGRVRDVVQLTDATVGGAWQPTLQGGTIAYTRRLGTSVDVRLKPLDPVESGASGDLATAAGLWVWPNLASDGRLRVSRPLPSGTGPRCTVPSGPLEGRCEEVARWNEAVEVREGTITPLLDDAPFSLEDVWAHPTRPEIVAGHGKFRRVGVGVPGCETSCADLASSPMPILLDTEGGAWRVLSLVSNDPALGTPGPVALVGCAHLAFAPDGARALCTEQGTPSLAAVGLQSRIFAFSVDLSVLESAGPPVVATVAEPLFTHLTAADLFDLGSRRCDIFHHKYAEWCGDSETIIATVGCAEVAPDGRATLLHDRLFAITFGDPSRPTYTDLTAAVERTTGRAEGALTSFTGTCE